MPTLHKDVNQYAATIAAPAGRVFDLIAAIAVWPQFHGPSVHAEPIASNTPGETTVRHWWVIDDHTVRTWEATWRFDRDALSVRYEFQPHEPGSAGLHGQWQLQADGDSTSIRAEQSPIGTGEHDTARAQADLAGLISAIAAAAEQHDERQDLVVDFEDPLFVAGPVEAAYEYLYEADKWPERIPHVTNLVLEEKVPNIQFFDMDTHTPDGSPHTTRSVRICLPGQKIVYKQIHLPKLLDGHTGHWKFEPTREGFILSSRHTAVIKPAALPVLGADTTVLDARKYLRRVLSANSMSNLRLAKAYAEERDA